jgi:hypothetical protein
MWRRTARFVENHSRDALIIVAVMFSILTFLFRPVFLGFLLMIIVLVAMIIVTIVPGCGIKVAPVQ